MATPVRRYRAFISYSQRDKRQVRRLHRALETYRVPKGVASDKIDPAKRKLGRFFRDDEEMGAAPDISASVQGAIEDSEGLIVVCSPRSAASDWVDKEILHYRRTSRGDQIYAVIIAGEPNSGNDNTECFPPSLRVEKVEGVMPIEPLALSLRKESFARVRARLAAGLLSVPFDDLWRRDRRRARGRIVVASIAVGVVLLIGAMGMGAIYGRGQQARSRMMAEMASVSYEAGYYDRAARFAMAGMRDSDAPFTGYDASRAEAELLRAAQASSALALWRAERGGIAQVAMDSWGQRFLRASADGAIEIIDVETGYRVQTLHLPRVSGRDGQPRDHTYIVAWLSPDGTRVVATAFEAPPRIWDVESGDQLAVLEGIEGSIDFAAFSPDNSRLVTATDRGVWLWGGYRGHLIARLDDWLEARFSPDGTRIATPSAVWNAGTGRLIANLDLSHITEQFEGDGRTPRPGAVVENLIFSPDGRLIVGGAYDGTRQVWNAANGAFVTELDEGGDIYGAAFSPDGQTLLTAGENNAYLWNTATWRREALVGVSGGDLVRFSPNGQRLLVVTRTVLQLFDTTVEVPAYMNGMRWLGSVVLAGHETLVYDAMFSADGSRIVSVAGNGDVRLWFADHDLITDDNGQMRIYVGAPTSRGSLLAFVCSVTLGNGLSRLSNAELRAAPILDPARDTDVCARP